MRVLWAGAGAGTGPGQQRADMGRAHGLLPRKSAVTPELLAAPSAFIGRSLGVQPSPAKAVSALERPIQANWGLREPNPRGPSLTAPPAVTTLRYALTPIARAWGRGAWALL